MKFLLELPNDVLSHILRMVLTDNAKGAVYREVCRLFRILVDDSSGIYFRCRPQLHDFQSAPSSTAYTMRRKVNLSLTDSVMKVNFNHRTLFDFIFLTDVRAQLSTYPIGTTIRTMVTVPSNIANESALWDYLRQSTPPPSNPTQPMEIKVLVCYVVGSNTLDWSSIVRAECHLQAQLSQSEMLPSWIPPSLPIFLFHSQIYVPMWVGTRSQSANPKKVVVGSFILHLDGSHVKMNQSINSISPTNVYWICSKRPSIASIGKSNLKKLSLVHPAQHNELNGLEEDRLTLEIVKPSSTFRLCGRQYGSIVIDTWSVFGENAMGPIVVQTLNVKVAHDYSWVGNIRKVTVTTLCAYRTTLEKPAPSRTLEVSILVIPEALSTIHPSWGPIFRGCTKLKSVHSKEELIEKFRK